MAAEELIFDGPAGARLTLVLAHGAGAPMDSPFMSTVARGVAERGFRVARFEFPAEGILRFADERHVNLIVMGVRKSGDSALPEHLPWPIASQVVAQSQCPVLTVRG